MGKVPASPQTTTKRKTGTAFPTKEATPVFRIHFRPDWRATALTDDTTVRGGVLHERTIIPPAVKSTQP
jgi:hypothetical protein